MKTITELLKSKLSEPTEEGYVPALILFDVVFEQLYDKKQTDPMVACELHEDKCQVIMFDSDDKEHILNIGYDMELGYWVDGLACHFNQYPVYKKMFHFIPELIDKLNS